MKGQTLYLKCKVGDIAPRVLLTGDPARVARLANLMDHAQEIANYREYAVATGTYRDIPVTVVSAGIGAPSTAIAMHELVQLGVRAIVRVGTMMGIHAPLESVVIPTGAARFEGTSSHYLPPAYPAVPDWRLVHTLVDAGRAAGVDLRLGLTATYDAFYVDMAPNLIDQSPPDLTLARRAGVLSMDMESSLVFVLGTMLGVAAASMCLVTVLAEPHVHLDLDQRTDGEQRMLRAALDGLVAFDN